MRELLVQSTQAESPNVPFGHILAHFGTICAIENFSDYIFYLYVTIGAQKIVHLGSTRALQVKYYRCNPDYVMSLIIRCECLNISWCQRSQQ